MRGTAVNELQEQDIDNCVEIIENEDLDAASTSYNFLESGEHKTILELELNAAIILKQPETLFPQAI